MYAYKRPLPKMGYCYYNNVAHLVGVYYVEKKL